MYSYVLFPFAIYAPFVLYNYFKKKPIDIDIYFEKIDETKTKFYIGYDEIYNIHLPDLLNVLTSHTDDYHYHDDNESLTIILEVKTDVEYSLKLHDEINEYEHNIKLIDHHQHLD